jgi:hypothetical protein
MSFKNQGQKVIEWKRVKPDTRQRRIEKTITALKNKKRL